MNPYVIVTDSSCDLPQSLIAQYGLEVVQLAVTVDGGAPTFNNELDIKDFYAQRGKLKSVENQPSIEAVTASIIEALGV